LIRRLLPIELAWGALAGGLALIVIALLRKLDWAFWWTITATAALLLVRPQALRLQSVAGMGLGAVVVTLVAAAAVALLFGKPRAENPWLFFISLGGVWATVPDTELISLLLGLTVPLAVASLPMRWSTQSWWGGVLAGALAAIVVLLQSGDRAVAAIGATGALAVAALPGRGMPGLLRHLILVMFWSRVAAHQANAWSALALGVGFTILATGAETLWGRFRRAATGRSR
jgi:hypothetical protein